MPGLRAKNYPFAGLLLDSSGNLYGTAAAGGALNGGVAYRSVREKRGNLTDKEYPSVVMAEWLSQCIF
jgi:hypothetical protein